MSEEHRSALRFNKDLKRRRLDFEDEDEEVHAEPLHGRRMAKRRRRTGRGAAHHRDEEPRQEEDQDEAGAPFTAALPPLSSEKEPEELAEEDDDLGIGANIEPEAIAEAGEEAEENEEYVDYNRDDQYEEVEQAHDEEEPDAGEEQEGEMSSGLHDDFRLLYAEADQHRRAQQAREQEEDARWREVIAAGDDGSWFPAMCSKTKLREMVLGGVPTRYRASLWRALCYSHPWTAQQRASCSSTYSRLVTSPNVGKAVEQIRLDLDRTLVDNTCFNAIPDRCAHLFDILKAYSYHNEAVGYCQGMAPVVGGMMTVIFNDELIASAEDDDLFQRNELIFWILATMLDGHNLARYYEPGMAGLLKDASVFHDALADHLPELAAHLDKYKLDSLMYMTPWFLSMYTHIPNWDLVLIVFDMFLVEGFAFAILEGCVEDLLSRQGLERILPYLLNLPTDKLRTDAIVQRAAAIDIDKLLEQAYLKAQQQPAPAQRSSAAAHAKGYPATPQRSRVPATPSRAVDGSAPSSSLIQRMFSAFPTPVRSKISLTSPFQPRTGHHTATPATTAASTTNAPSTLAFLSPFTARPVKRPRPIMAVIASSGLDSKPQLKQPQAMRPTTPYPSAAKRPLMPPHQFQQHQRSSSSTTSHLQQSSASNRGSQTPMLLPSALKRTRYQQHVGSQPLSPLRNSSSSVTNVSPAKRRRTDGWMASLSPSAKKSPSARSSPGVGPTTPRSAALRSLVSSSASGAFMSPASSPLSPIKETPSRRPKKIRTKRTAAKRRFDEEDKENSPNIKPNDDSLKSFITPTKLRVVTSNTTPYKRARTESGEVSGSPLAAKQGYYFSPSKSPVVVEGAIELKSIAIHQHKKILFED